MTFLEQISFWKTRIKSIWYSLLHTKELTKDFLQETRWEIEWRYKGGQEKIWGDSDTVRSIAEFYDKFEDKIEMRKRIRCSRGMNTASGLVQDMKKCHEQYLLEQKKIKRTAENEENAKKIREKKEALRKVM